MTEMQPLLDKTAIRDVVENWVIWRDAGDWEKFATLWHADGWMMTTWFQASAADFIARSRKGFENGLKVLHTSGGTSIELVGNRAVVQSKMEITQRADVDGVLVDVCCKGRMVDAMIREDGRWSIMLRQPVYELDRMTPVDPAVRLELDPALLARFPEGYRHLAYLQVRQGMDVYEKMPGTRGPEIDALWQRMSLWLEGQPANCLHY